MHLGPADVYDLIYAEIGKHYANEVSQLHNLIQQHKRSSGNDLLDVACGTGAHMEFFRHEYSVAGLDLDKTMLDVARKKFPDVVFHHGDMVDFCLNRAFDVVVCLFSAIGYVQTLTRLQLAIASMVQHTKPGGVLVVEPWLKPEDFQPGMVHAVHVDQPELKVTRTNTIKLNGHLTEIDFHYLIGSPAGVRYLKETHTLGMFEHSAYVEAFRQAGVELYYDPAGLNDRGLYVAIKPQAT